MAGFLVGSGCVSKVVVSGRGSAAVAVKYCAVYEKMRVKVQSGGKIRVSCRVAAARRLEMTCDLIRGGCSHALVAVT
jgi:hypothetical protein